ncbi:MAG: phosphoribosyltransferase [Pseudomonadota bacterium]
MDKFENRHSAGVLLTTLLSAYADRRDAIVLALPRGGVPVGYEIAKLLHLPLDVFIVRKLGVPGQPELAMGAISSGNEPVFNNQVVRDLRISHEAIEQVLAAEQQELKRREKTYRRGRGPLNVKDKIVILVDDGVATGATIRAAIQALRRLHPAFIIVAVPVIEKSIFSKLALLADKVIFLSKPDNLWAVGAHYEEFDQTSDKEVTMLLASNVAKGEKDDSRDH